MDIQGFIPPATTAPEDHSVLSYKEASSSDRLNLPSTSEYKPPSMHTILPTVVEEDYSTNSQANTPPPALPSSSGSAHTVTLVHDETMPSQEIMEEEEYEEEEDDDEENNRNTLNPALLLNRYDKRKSSPAILGLPFGLKHEAQLSLHLSQQRNSIEAAMLLANFNKLMAFPKANENEHKVVLPQQQHWQDDMSIPSQNKSSWVDKLPTEANRRHSYDVNMSWQTMPESFLERPDLLHNIHQSTNSINATNASIAAAHAATAPSASNVPVFKQESFYHTPTKVSWSHDDLHPSHPLPPHHPHHPTHPYSSSSSTSSSSVEYVNHPISPRGRMYHPNMSSPLVSHTYSRYPQEQHHPLHPGIPVLHPLARQPEMNSHGNSMKRELDPHQHPYYTYTFPPQHPMQPPPPPPSSSSSSQQRYYYPANGKLPLPSQQSMDPQQQILLAQQIHPPPQLVSKPKRKKQKVAQHEEYEEILEEETNEEDYPEMSTRDIEAARNDPEARPRKQKLRFVGDKYTPQWVRYNGQSKEGLCDTCKPGKWLQLKNSAYWYHKQFFHGISSVSGKEFVQPLETRWVDQDLVEGLCHQCHTWVAVSNVKRKNSVLWYRHAHKCHVYHKPKPNVPKKR
ncbi:uncharacterized protein B0P05DRAFT_535527 [Gilbertella persicaria]|uniref:uncharacterized protein n=1 Tax=Gilbertella persicaria TaxID=101096 RepID=UPI0022211D6B|nr:uncharacterized protein B0P05DRAFT_535527 [Gilbertella persicaria]KAI8084423.1 hypothetical protein B0P05DRAFT_535527 [Gilbertella persicaria]